MVGKSRRPFSKQPLHPGSRPAASNRRGQTLVLTHPSTELQPTADMDDDAYAATLRQLEEDCEPLFDHSYLSHISKEFASMRPFDFELPKYEFYEDNDESWFDDSKSLDEATLEDLLISNELDEAEDVATTIHFIFPGKPKVVDVSPPASIRSRNSISSSRSGALDYHSRSSSYSANSHTDDRKSIDSASASSTEEEEEEEEDYSSDDYVYTPSTPASMYSTGTKSFFPRLDFKMQEPKYCSIAVARPAPLIIRKA